jgi:rubrerythrin
MENTRNNGVVQSNGNDDSVQKDAKKRVGYEFETDGYQPEDLDTRWTRWKCGVCNYLYESSKVLKKCPKCGNDDPDKFIDVD